jgi:EmrB/QacA subfamily drug resistance transporter
MNTANAEKSKDKGPALLVATLASFLTPFMGSSVNIALPSIGGEFGMNAVSLSWIVTSYLLAAAMFLVPMGRIADIHGRKKIFRIGICIDLVASLGLVISSNEVQFLFLRVLQGMGGAMIFGTGVAILTSVFPVGERGKALGINVAAVYSGLSLGPFVGGFLTQHLGWRAIFVSYVPLELVVVALTFWKLKGEWAGAEGEKFDLAGSAVYGLSLVALMYGFSLLPASSAIWLILLGAVGIMAFVRWEMRTESPVFNTNLFRHNVVFAFSNLAALINYCATSATAFLLSLYLQYTKGLTPEKAGLVLISQPVMMAVFSPLAGRLSDKIEPRIVASSGMALTAVGLALFASLGETTALNSIILSLALLGFGFALFSSPNTNAVMSSVQKEFYGVASATLATMRLTGQMLSMGIAMLVFALYLGRTQITPENYPLFLRSAKTAFVIFAVLCVAGVFASLARGDVRSKKSSGALSEKQQIP